MIPRSKIGDASRCFFTGLTLGVAALFLLLGPAPAVRAASQAGDEEPPVQAALIEPSVEAGGTTEYRITVNGARDGDDPPVPPVVDGLSILPPNQPSHLDSINIVNGRVTRLNLTIYEYLVRTSKAGEFTFPAQTIRVNGVPHRTEPLVLTVREPGAPAPAAPGQTVSAELLVPKKTVYVGESFLVELRTYFGLNVHVVDPDEAPQLGGEGFSAQRFTRPRTGGTILKGVRYNAYVYRAAVTGVKTGPLAIGPMETTPTVQMMSPQTLPQGPGGGGMGSFGSGRGGFPFGGLFDDPNIRVVQPPQQIKLTAPAVPVEVLPLPAGKPENFSGGIGQFKLEAEAVPRRAQAGDPVTVRLILTAQRGGNFPRVNAPVLTDERGLRTYPPTSQFKADDDVGLTGTKTFEQVIVANGPRDSLPAFRFDYLDPTTGKYGTLDTGPIAVQIEGSAAPPPAVSTAPAAANPPPAATPTPTPAVAQDILYIRNDPGTVRDRTAFLPGYRRPVFWWAQLVPLAGLLLAGGLLALQARGRNETARRLAALHRQQGELRLALRGEGTSRRDFYSAATRLAQLRAAGRPGEEALSAAEIAWKQGLDPQTANSIQEIFQRHDELAYSGGEVAREPVSADERQTVLATLESLGRRGR